MKFTLTTYLQCAHLWVVLLFSGAYAFDGEDRVIQVDRHSVFFANMQKGARFYLEHDSHQSSLHLLGNLKQFQRLEDLPYGYSLKKHKLWLLLDSSRLIGEKYAYLSFPWNVAKLHYYHYSSDLKLIQIERLGLSYGFSSTQVVDRHLRVKLASVREGDLLLLSIESPYPYVTNVRAMSFYDYHLKDHSKQMFIGLYFGLVFVMMIFVFFAYLFFRRSLYLYYLGHILCGHVFCMAASWGLVGEYIGGLGIDFAFWLPLFSSFFARIFASAFCLKFLDLPFPRWLKVFFITEAAGIICILLFPQFHHFFVLLQNISILAASLVFTFLAFFCKHRLAKTSSTFFVFIIGWLPFLICMNIFMISLYNLIDYSFYYKTAYYYSECLELLLSSWAILQKLREEKNIHSQLIQSHRQLEKERVRQEAIIHTAGQFVKDLERPFTLMRLYLVRLLTKNSSLEDDKMVQNIMEDIDRVNDTINDLLIIEKKPQSDKAEIELKTWCQNIASDFLKSDCCILAIQKDLLLQVDESSFTKAFVSLCKIISTVGHDQYVVEAASLEDGGLKLEIFGNNCLHGSVLNRQYEKSLRYTVSARIIEAHGGGIRILHEEGRLGFTMHFPACFVGIKSEQNKMAARPDFI